MIEISFVASICEDRGGDNDEYGSSRDFAPKQTVNWQY